MSLVALGGGRLPPPCGGAIPDGADDLAVGEGLGGGALPYLRRAEQLRLPGKFLISFQIHGNSINKVW